MAIDQPSSSIEDAMEEQLQQQQQQQQEEQQPQEQELQNDLPTSTWNYGPRGAISLNEAQFSHVCDVLLINNNIDRLRTFLWRRRESLQFRENESVLRARAAVAFKEGDFNGLYSIIQNNEFSEQNHKELQMLWRDAHNLEVENLRGRPLSAVAKYRVRRSFPYPMTIWNIY